MKSFWPRAFTDLEKENHRVDKEALWQMRRLYEVGGNLMEAVQRSYEVSKACVRIRNEVSE